MILLLKSTNLLYACYRMLCLREVGLMTMYSFYEKLTYTSVWNDGTSAHVAKNGKELLINLTELMTSGIRNEWVSDIA